MFKIDSAVSSLTLQCQRPCWVCPSSVNDTPKFWLNCVSDTTEFWLSSVMTPLNLTRQCQCSSDLVGSMTLTETIRLNIWFWTYLIQNYLIQNPSHSESPEQNPSNTKSIRYRIHQIPNLSVFRDMNWQINQQNSCFLQNNFTIWIDGLGRCLMKKSELKYLARLGL